MKYTTSRSELPDRIAAIMLDANVYYSEEYERMQKTSGYDPVFFYDDYYVLCIYIVKKYMFRYGALPVEPICIKEYDEQKLRAFLDEVMYISQKEYRLHWVGPTQNQALFMTCPSNSISIPYGSHVVDLRLDTAELWDNLHSKHRNSIRKAEKDGLTIVTGLSKDNLDSYYALDRITWDRSGRKSETAGILENMIRFCPDNVSLYIANKGDIPQGGAILFYNAKRSYYLFGASVDNPSPGAMNFLHWNAIQDMKNKGVSEYSFVGCRINEDSDSKVHTIQRFKERFGGELRVGVMFKCVLNPMVYRLYVWMVCLKNYRGRKHSLDIIDEEIHKWN